MAARTSKLLKEVEKTNAIADRIVGLASKEKKAAGGALAKLRTIQGGKAGAKGRSARRRPGMARGAEKCSQSN
jgi:hypothetical protein